MIAFVTQGIDNDELLKHLGLVRHVVNQHRNHPGMAALGRDDADGVAQCALVEAARSYDPDARENSTFAGYACFVMRRRLRRALFRASRGASVDSDEEPTVPSAAEESASAGEERDRLVMAWKELDIADKILISEHFGMGLCESMSLSLEQLAEPYGITKSAMSRRVARALDRLRSLVEEMS